MVQLVTRKSALGLYGVLLVLPTIVLGGLLWRQLVDDHQAEMAAVPDETTNAARRLSGVIEDSLRALVERENLRPFYYYRRSYFEPRTIAASLAFIPSPLVMDPVPDGILGWFTYPRDVDSPEIEVFGGNRELVPSWPERKAELERATASFAAGDAETQSDNNVHRVGSVRVDPLSLPVAAINASQEPDPECLKTELPKLKDLEGQSLDVKIFSFNLRFYVEPGGTPRIIATRNVLIDQSLLLRQMPACFDRLGWGLHVIQGFYIDPDWLFARLPRALASTTLDPSQEFIAAGAGPREVQANNFRFHSHPGAILADILPLENFEIETANPEDLSFGRMRILGNTANLEERFHSQMLHFLSVAAMLVLSLATGLALLLRSVRRDLEAAQRTENFVASVTHELRTPLSAIRMHGEMLREGWVQDEAKRHEYYRRIVRETDRLETMVERVLEKSRLSTAEATPEPGDVNALVEALGPSLIGTGTEHAAKDVVFDLAPELPSALVVPEGVRSIVTNLVENARKYAPVDANTPGAEPIRVATLLADGSPSLEVRDRGPGIPREERGRIFDAFYRIGNETTRTAKGTGLGLHLAALHCEGMGARIQALDRQGGGTVFRVTFQRA